MTELNIEQGPIRPPSEAYSLLLRVTRNCPWNRCEFCRTYKEEKFGLRPVEEIKKDIDTVREIVSEIKTFSWMQGFGGEITAPLANFILQNPQRLPEGFRSVALWLFNGGQNVFLQDGDNLTLKTADLVEVLSYLKGNFPSIQRITTYARAKTVSRRTVEDLQALRDAGLSRIHIGLESGYDPLLQLMKKGVTAQEHVDAGKKVKASGISLSEYVILGLGGKAMGREHAIETARVLNRINPDFIRVRTLKVLKEMPLHEKIEEGTFIPLTDDEVVEEERLLVEQLDGITSTFVSDHVLNLLEEVGGTFPEEKSKMLSVINRYLALSPEKKINFRLGRRGGLYRSLDDPLSEERHKQVQTALERIETERPGAVEQVISDLMESFI
jgi:hypothetical protein